MKNNISISALLLILLFALNSLQSCKEVKKDLNNAKTDSQKQIDSIYQVTDALFWTQSEREDRFSKMDKYTQTSNIKRGGETQELKYGIPIEIPLELNEVSFSIDDYMDSQNTVGIVILVNGEIRLEKYRNNVNSDTRWISFSVAKSITSTLVGAAIKDGYIKSIDDPITDYIPELVGSGYDGIPIRHILTMSSGVKWNEDYSDPESDVAQMTNIKLEKGQDPTIVYMKKFKSESKPGLSWNYNTGETNLIGALVTKATGKTLSEYLSEKIWKPLGMEQDAYWALNAGVIEHGGCCISATVRDFARFGQFVLDEIRTEKSNVLPKNWFNEAGKKQIDRDKSVEGEKGYGYQWWTNDDGSFEAQGIYGQGIFIDPARNLVIVTNSNFVSAVDSKSWNTLTQFHKSVQQAIDAEK